MFAQVWLTRSIQVVVLVFHYNLFFLPLNHPYKSFRISFSSTVVKDFPVAPITLWGGPYLYL